MYKTRNQHSTDRSHTSASNSPSCVGRCAPASYTILAPVAAMVLHVSRYVKTILSICAPRHFLYMFARTARPDFEVSCQHYPATRSLSTPRGRCFPHPAAPDASHIQRSDVPIQNAMHESGKATATPSHTDCPVRLLYNVLCHRAYAACGVSQVASMQPS